MRIDSRIAWLFCIGAMLIAGCATVPALEGSNREQQIVDFWTKDMRYPECSVAFVTPSGTRLAGDAGRMYRLASLTKFYLHLAFLDLAESKAIDLDASVARYSKLALPPEYATVTLRDLIENRSGLPREFMNYWNPLDGHEAFMCGIFGTHIYADFESKEDFTRELNRPRWREAVVKRVPQYSNVGFALLAMTVEDATGKSIDDILAAYLAKKGSFPHTAFIPSEEQKPFVTKPCAGKLPWLVRRGHEINPHTLGPALRGTGALISSVDDTVKMFNIYRGEVVSKLLAEKPLSECVEDEVRGLLKVHVLESGRRILYRYGFIYGGQTFVAFDPETDSYLLMMRNVTTWPAYEDFIIADRMFAALAAERK